MSTGLIETRRGFK